MSAAGCAQRGWDAAGSARWVEASLVALLVGFTGCNFSLEPSWVPPRDTDGAADASRRPDAEAKKPGVENAGVEDAGLPGALSHWCRSKCAAPHADADTCAQVVCADASVCADRPPCDVCVLCEDGDEQSSTN